MITLDQQFTVPLGMDDAWDLLTDLPQVARCLPGASLDEVVDEEYRGGLATKIGPINATYRGVAAFRERDDVAHRAVVEARGREAKGNGSASALITLHLEPDGEASLVKVSTELAISGRAAQFGRSLLAEVSNAMLQVFVQRLEAMIANPDAPADTPAEQPLATGAGGIPPTVHADDLGAAGESLDVFRTLVMPMARRAALPIAAAALGGLIGVWTGRRGRLDAGLIPVTYVLPYPGTSWPPPFGHLSGDTPS